MGSFFKKAFAAIGAVAGGPIGAVGGHYLGRSLDGKTGYTEPADHIQHSEQVPLDQLQFDESGFPVGQFGPPSARVAPAWHLAERAAVGRQNSYFHDAIASLKQGTRVMESYRPGGAAALASNQYGQQANLLFNIGQQQRAPDLLFDYRRDQGAKAQQEQNRAAERQIIGGIIQAGATVAGAAVGGPAGAVVGSAAGGALAGQAAGGAGAQPGTVQNYQSPTLASGLQSEGGGQQQGGGPAPGVEGGPRVNGPQPGGPGGGQGAPAPGGGRAGGFGSNGDFTSTALAASAARINPMVEPVVTIMQAQTMDTAFVTAVGAAVDRMLEQSLWAMAAA